MALVRRTFLPTKCFSAFVNLKLAYLKYSYLVRFSSREQRIGKVKP
jgi:hypothetical protein